MSPASVERLSIPMPTPASDPHSIPLTESEVLIRGYLAANPTLDAVLGPVEIMTDRYTNAEWAKQIRETTRAVMTELKSGKRARKVYEGPRMENGKEALRELAMTIDHTVLKLDASATVIDGLCSEARTEKFKSVCVRLHWVQRCISNLKGSGVVVACVVGFHEGTQATFCKLREARAAVEAGASELDVVLNHSILTAHSKCPSSQRVARSHDSAIDSITAANTAANSRSDHAESDSDSEEDYLPDYSAIYRELASIRSLCPHPVVLKLILETSELNDQQIIAASHLAAAASFDFIKTSTGFNGPGATINHVQLMVGAAEYLASKRIGRGKMSVKASGGVRSLQTAVLMLEAGAKRLGTSSGIWIMQEARKSVGEVRERRNMNSDTVSDMDTQNNGLTRLYTDDSLY